MKDLTLSHVTPLMVKKNAFAQMPLNMEPNVIKHVDLEKTLKSIKIEMVANVLEPKLEPNLLIMIVKIVKLAIIPKEHVTKNVL
jgi:hypothetical protein